MNLSILRALFKDALYQVLDNSMFRLLVLLVIFLVLPTFLVGFKEEYISLLFGWKEITYEEIISSFGGLPPGSTASEMNIQMIQGFQSLFVEYFAGMLGVSFCIAATAFFVPRMLEKGAADTVFSKPLGRFTLLMARYFSGILFVGILSTILVLGVHLGLVITSGYSDPGFLWGILTLIYLYAILHAFSVCIATLSRSSVMAILCTLMLYAGNGCVNVIWVGKEFAVSQQEINQQLEDGEDGERDGPGGAARFFMTVLDTLHYLLPRTGDADIITQKLRRSIQGGGPVWIDDELDLEIKEHPTAFTMMGGDILGGGVLWTGKGAAGVEKGRITLSRRNRKEDASLPRTSLASVRALEEELESRSDIHGEPERANIRAGRGSTQSLRWMETSPAGLRAREAHYLTFGAWIYFLDIEADAAWYAEEDVATTVESFLAGFGFAGGFQDPSIWYPDQMSWTARPRYNLFLSIGQSLLFAGIMIGIATWRLMRADF